MITTSHISRGCVDPVATYQATFPIFHSLPWQKDDLQHSSLARKRRHSILGSTRLEASWVPPPPYLRHTHYAALVREQHQARLQKRNDNDKKLLMNNNDSGSTNRPHLLPLCINPETTDN
ncbi:unnamed protein product [Absidia cylindrospora]